MKQSTVSVLHHPSGNIAQSTWPFFEGDNKALQIYLKYSEQNSKEHTAGREWESVLPCDATA